MRYVDVPKEVSFEQLRSNTCSFSASQYKSIILNNSKFVYVRDFLTRELTYDDLGNEVGSLNYISRSPKYFARTKLLQSHSSIPEIAGEAVIPVNPKAFIDQNLKEGEILISKDSNIGEVVILDKDYPDWMLSGALYRLPVGKLKYYLFAFMKHDFFRQQLDFIVPKSATIRHAKTLFLDCKIPLPSSNEENVTEYVEVLMKAAIEKEKRIRKNHLSIHEKIEKELENNQKSKIFEYEYPSLNNLKKNGRIDAGFYCEELQKLTYKTLNYNYGYKPLTEQGLQLIPGPSLEIKLLGTRIDSDTYLPGFYRLITPKQISNYGTAIYYEYIGTPRKIAPIQYGDILFGESGTGRTMMYLEKGVHTINNAHAHILRPIEGSCTIEKAITIRSILQYYKEIGVTDFLTVGGSGGHLSPSYFDRVFIPNFPEEKEKEIALLYHNSKAVSNVSGLTLSNFLEKDQAFNDIAGITELDRAAKRIKARLDEVIDQIVKDQPVEITFDFLNQ